MSEPKLNTSRRDSREDQRLDGFATKIIEGFFQEAKCPCPYSHDAIKQLVRHARSVIKMTEEGEKVFFRLSLEGRSNDRFVRCFTRPVSLVGGGGESLRRLAAAIDSNKNLICVDPDTEQVWGIRRFPMNRAARNRLRYEGQGNGKPPGLVLSGRPGGLLALSIKDSVPYGYIVDCEYYDYDPSHVLYMRQEYDDAYHALFDSDITTDELGNFKRRLDYLVTEIYQAGYGATLVLVPASMRQEFKNQIDVGIAFDEPGNNELERRDSDTRVTLNELARLSRADGAVLLSQHLTLLAAGVMLEGKPNNQSPETACTPESCLSGKRHQSAFRFANDYPGVICFVISQSKTISIYYREVSGTEVIAKKMDMVEP